MVAMPALRPVRVGTYNNGQPYAVPRGRYAPRERLTDRLAPSNAVIDLSKERPSAGVFLRAILRELRIRFYQPKTVKNYRTALTGLFRWFNAPPHLLTREDVREYLEVLVDGGASASWVSIHLSGIRTAFDKMCGRDVTLGLETPRRGRRLPVVLSPAEVMRLLEAAPSLRDKLLMGLMYATGARVGEVCRLRWRDFDFDRRVVNIWQGKGRVDRQVMLPVSFEPLLRHIANTFQAEDYVFPAASAGRHISPRTAERAMERAVKIAGIGKRATPHSLRHSFATHLFEHGTDIRYIQRLLGHAKLETTTIYTKVAVIRQQQIQSPLDTLVGKRASQACPPGGRPAGRLRIDLRRRPGEPSADVTLTILSEDHDVALGGIVVREPRPGWITLEVPPLEAWHESLLWLTPPQRERIESPEFYKLLQEQIGRRYLASAVR